MSTQVWHVGHSKAVDLSSPCVVAILNITPDSFADGGRLGSVELAAEHADRCVRDGAAVLGGIKKTKKKKEKKTTKKERPKER